VEGEENKAVLVVVLARRGDAPSGGAMASTRWLGSFSQLSVACRRRKEAREGVHKGKERREIRWEDKGRSRWERWWRGGAVWSKA
jgi:hypothetical protein